MPSAENPAHVKAFDHTQIASLPEYRALAASMDALVHAIITAQIDIPQTRWLEMTSEIAAAVPFADSCECGNSLTYAHKVTIDNNGWLVGTYNCPACGTTHTCGWSTEAPGLFS